MRLWQLALSSVGHPASICAHIHAPTHVLPLTTVCALCARGRGVTWHGLVLVSLPAGVVQQMGKCPIPPTHSTSRCGSQCCVVSGVCWVWTRVIP